MKSIFGKRHIPLVLLIFLLVIPYSHAGTTSTSGVTAQDIIDSVRVDLDETIEGHWLDSDFIQWIDEAVREVVNRTGGLESGASNIIIIDQKRSYALPGLSFLDIEKVEHDSGVTTDRIMIFDLTRAPFRNMRLPKLKETGRPKTFSIWANELYIWPTPIDDTDAGVTLSGTTLVVYPITLPVGVTSASSQIETPAYFDLALVHYVKYKALLEDNIEKKAEYFRKLFYEMIEYYRLRIIKREIQ